MDGQMSMFSKLVKTISIVHPTKVDLTNDNYVLILWKVQKFPNEVKKMVAISQPKLLEFNSLDSYLKTVALLKYQILIYPNW